ncbi:MAG: hypothetical protein MHM6MM_003351 [Cercozoa sp. M6MM]
MTREDFVATLDPDAAAMLETDLTTRGRNVLKYLGVWREPVPISQLLGTLPPPPILPSLSVLTPKQPAGVAAAETPTSTKMIFDSDSDINDRSSDSDFSIIAVRRRPRKKRRLTMLPQKKKASSPMLQKKATKKAPAFCRLTCARLTASQAAAISTSEAWQLRHVSAASGASDSDSSDELREIWLRATSVLADDTLPFALSKTLRNKLYIDAFRAYLSVVSSKSPTVPTDLIEAMRGDFFDSTGDTDLHHPVQEILDIGLTADDYVPDFVPLEQLQHPSLRVQLRFFQLRATRFMLWREKAAPAHGIPQSLLWHRVSPHWQVCLRTSQVREISPSADLERTFEKQTVTRISGGILGDEMGLGKTLEIINLVLQHPCDRKDCVKTTLVVCPQALLHQWQREIRERVQSGSLSVATYTGTKTTMNLEFDVSDDEEASTPDFDFGAFDIVLTTFEVLRRDVHFDQDFEALAQRLRREKLYKSKRTPLRSVVFWRVVLDECQMAESRASNTAKMAKALEARHRWAVSGTPLSPHGGADDLAMLLDYLGAPHCLTPASSFWRTFISTPLLHKSNKALRALEAVLAPLFWRQTKASVQNEFRLPAQTVRDVGVHMTRVERFHYDQLAKAKQEAVKHILRNVVGAQHLSVRLRRRVFNELLPLRQACDHMSLATKSLSGAVSEQEILQQLLRKEQQKTDQAVRELALPCNGAGGILLSLQAPALAARAFACVLHLANVHLGREQMHQELTKTRKERELINRIGRVYQQLKGESETRVDDVVLTIEIASNPPQEVQGDSNWFPVEFMETSVHSWTEDAQDVRVLECLQRHLRQRIVGDANYRHARAVAEWRRRRQQVQNLVTLLAPSNFGESCAWWTVLLSDVSAYDAAEYLDRLHDALHRLEDRGTKRRRFIDIKQVSKFLLEALQNARLVLQEIDRCVKSLCADDVSESQVKQFAACNYCAFLYGQKTESEEDITLRAAGRNVLPRPKHCVLCAALKVVNQVRALVFDTTKSSLTLHSEGNFRRTSALETVLRETARLASRSKDDRVEQGKQFLNEFNKLHALYESASALYSERRDQVGVHDALRQATLRVRLLGESDEAPSDTIDALIIPTRDEALLRIETLRVEAQDARERLRGQVSQLRYLQSLQTARAKGSPKQSDSENTGDVSSEVTNNEVKSEATSEVTSDESDDDGDLVNENRCVVCCELWSFIQQRDDKVSVWPCGHRICIQCAPIYLKRFARGGRIRCASCRSTCAKNEVVTALMHRLADEGQSRVSQPETAPIDSTEEEKHKRQLREKFGSKVAAVASLLFRAEAENRETPSAQKILVFSEWPAILETLAQALVVPRDGMTVQHELATKRGKDFEQKLRTFRTEPRCTALLLPRRSAAAGLTVVEANGVLLMEPWLDLAAVAQAKGRVHRIGQTRETTVYRFLTEDTIERAVAHMQDSRQDSLFVSESEVWGAPQILAMLERNATSRHSRRESNPEPGLSRDSHTAVCYRSPLR